MSTTPFATVDDYIASFPPDIQTVLKQIQVVILEVAPDATPKISYNMPSYRLNGKAICHFAAWKKHVGMYPLPTGDADFQKAVEPYRATRDTAQFKYSEPIPYDLIRRIVELTILES